MSSVSSDHATRQAQRVAKYAERETREVIFQQAITEARSLEERKAAALARNKLLKAFPSLETTPMSKMATLER